MMCSDEKDSLERAVYVAPECCCIGLSPHSLLAALSVEGELGGFGFDSAEFYGEEEEQPLKDL